MTEQIAVIGLGLIGGSLSRRLALAHDVICYDADPLTRELAESAGLTVTDDPMAAIQQASIAFVAVPLLVLSTVVGQVSSMLPGGGVATDVGSVKSPLYAAVRADGLQARFVGGHPMAGTEQSGFAASDPGLYDGAAWVLCLQEDTDLTKWLRVAAVLTGIGARVVPATAAEHDAAVARVSHLPHLLAAALASTVADAGPLALTLAAGSFRDGTRVAATAPELPTSMCRDNVDAVRAALAETVDRLRSAHAEAGSLIAAGHTARLAWGNRHGVPAELATADERLPDQLLALGRRGGWISQVTPQTLSVVVPKPV